MVLRRWLAVALGAVVAIAFFALNAFSSAGGSRDYDEGVYWQALRSLSAGHHLFSEVYAAQGPVFFYGLLPFYSGLGHTIQAARLAIAFYALLAAVAIFVAGRAVAGPWAGFIAALLLSSDPVWASEAQTLHAEVPSLALGLVAVAVAGIAVRADSNRHSRDWLAAVSGVALALGTASKAFAVIFLVPIVLLFLLSGRARAIRSVVLAAAGFLAAAVIVFLPFIENAQAVYDELIGLRLAARHALDAGMAANFRLLHPGRELPLEIGAILVGSLGLLLPQRKTLPFLVWIVVSILALLLYQPLFPHELALLIPPLALTAAVGIAELSQVGTGWRLANSRLIARAAAFAVLLVSGVAGYRDWHATQVAARPNPHDDLLAARLQTVAPGDSLIIGDNPYAIALADRSTPPQLVDTSFARVVSGSLTAAQIEAISDSQQVKAFVIDTGRLGSAAGLVDWVAQNYPRVDVINGGRIYSKP